MGKNILYVVPAVGLGGSETFLYQTGLHHSSGYHPVYACLRSGPLVDRLRSLGHDVIVAPSPPRLRNPGSILATVRWLSALIRDRHIHLVHSTLAYGALFGALAARAGKVPHVWFQHGPVTGWQDRLAGWLPARRILVNSHYTAQRQRALSPRKPLERIPLGVPASTISTARAREGTLHEELDVSFLSAMLCRPQTQKGIELWIQASALLRARGIAAGCVLVGGDPREPYGVSIAAAALAASVPWLHLAGNALPWETLVQADALVCASISPEGFGLSLAEALAHGVPAVAPREGGPLDFLREGENGTFFEPRNAADLARALGSLARNPGRALALAGAGRDFAREFLSAEESVLALERAYERTLEGL